MEPACLAGHWSGRTTPQNLYKGIYMGHACKKGRGMGLLSLRGQIRTNGISLNSHTTGCPKAASEERNTSEQT